MKPSAIFPHPGAQTGVRGRVAVCGRSVYVVTIHPRVRYSREEAAAPAIYLESMPLRELHPRDAADLEKGVRIGLCVMEHRGFRHRSEGYRFNDFPRTGARGAVLATVLPEIAAEIPDLSAHQRIELTRVLLSPKT